MSSVSRFCAYLRIKHMLHYLCGSPSIHLSFNLAVVLPRRCVYRFRCDTENKFPTSNTSFAAWTTRYLILFATHARSSVSVMIQKAAFAIGILSNIYEFHLYTRNSAFLYHTLAEKFDGSSRLSSGVLPTFPATYELFSPVFELR